MSAPRSHQPTPKNGQVRDIGLIDRIRDTCPASPAAANTLGTGLTVLTSFFGG